MKPDTSGRARARFGAIGLLLGALAAPACDAIGPSLEDQRRLALARNRALWVSEGILSYRYTYSYSCGECAAWAQEPVRITVEAGEITSLESVRDDAEPISEDRWEAFDTIEGIFAAIEAAIDARPHRLEVTYDDRLGYPVSVAVTVTDDPRLLDDFWGTSVKDLVVLGRSP